MQSPTKDGVALTFMATFSLEAILSQVVLTKRPTKQTTILLLPMSVLYFIPVGCQFRKMCHEINVSYEPIDTIPILLACICLALNITIEILYDQWRIDENVIIHLMYQPENTMEITFVETFKGTIYTLPIWISRQITHLKC